MAEEFLETHVWSIKQLFDYSYNVPVYQRPYSWQTEQTENLYYDICEAYKEHQSLDDNNKYLSGLYVGNIILYSQRLGEFDIIDGQQRIATFTLLILALYAKSVELDSSMSDRIFIKLQAALWELDASDMPRCDKCRLTLGGIDKEFFNRILDMAYNSPENIRQFITQYYSVSQAEENIKTNFITLYDYLTKDYKVAKDLLLFANFILTRVYLIGIVPNGTEVKAFSIFESINSKGKKLEEIDLIKTYIFSKIKEKDHKVYLAKWGDLIINTKDDLYGYLKTYIRAYIKYYTQNISYLNFKTLDNIMCEVFNVSDVGDAFKELINSLTEKVNNYKALFDVELCNQILSSNKLKFYFAVYVKAKYEHPRALFFRTLSEYDKGRGELKKDEAIDIFIEIIKMTISFETISQKDSKDIIDVYRTIFEDIYSKNKIDRNLILYRIMSKMQTSGLRSIDIETSLTKIDLFNKNKILGAALISFYESRVSEDNTNSNFKLSWDEAFAKFSTFGGSYSLDHIMNRTPNINDGNLKYYKLGNNLKLKPGHDFPEELVHDGMEYDDFECVILNTAGNLRLKGRDGNSSRGNTSEVNFCTFSALKERTKIIAKFIMDNFLSFEKLPDNYAYNGGTNSVKNRSRITGNFDFSKDSIDLKGIKVQSLTIFDTTYEIAHNKDILIKLVTYLYQFEDNGQQRFEQQILKMAEDGWKTHKRIMLTWDRSKLVNPFEIIKDKVYLETNLSSNDIFSYAKDFLKALQFPLDLVTIYVPE